MNWSVAAFRSTLSKAANKRRLEKAELALEQHALGKVQAGIDANEAEAAAKLIASLEPFGSVAIAIGSLIVVKTPVANGQPSLVVRQLTAEQQIKLKDCPEAMDRLVSQCSSKAGNPNCQIQELNDPREVKAIDCGASLDDQVDSA